MKYKNIFWGILLISIGVLFVLKALNIIAFTWGNVVSLWSLLLIWAGVCVLPLKDIVKLLLSLLILGVGIVLLVRFPQCLGIFNFCNIE
ncbi:MAG: DUF5668 domain-containing protein [Bacteroidales bacterium]|jgi:hypothetical protein|nr:DUF5668 domain-containing protein [Bacteroidales bacterium]